LTTINEILGALFPTLIFNPTCCEVAFPVSDFNHPPRLAEVKDANNRTEQIIRKNANPNLISFNFFILSLLKTHIGYLPSFINISKLKTV
jgi:hypothetical protein